MKRSTLSLVMTPMSSCNNSLTCSANIMMGSSSKQRVGQSSLLILPSNGLRANPGSLLWQILVVVMLDWQPVYHRLVMVNDIGDAMTVCSAQLVQVCKHSFMHR